MTARLMTGSSSSSSPRTPSSQRSTARAVRRPRPAASMMVAGPVTKSPQAKTPSTLVSKVSWLMTT